MPTLAETLATIKQDEIAGQIDVMREEVKRLRVLIDFHIGAIQALQAICTHPKKVARCSTGESWTACAVCGKEV
jgi:hypothetical protein